MALSPSAFGRVFDAQPVISLVLDRASTVLAVTDALLQLTGTAREALVGRALTPEVLAPFGAAWSAELAAVLQQGESPLSLPPVFFPAPAGSPHAGLLPWWTPQLVPVPGEDATTVDYVVCSAQQTLAPVPSSPLVSPLAPRLAELQFILDQVPAHILAVLEPTHVPAYVSPSMRQLLDNRPRVGTPLADTLPELVDPGLMHLFDEVYRTGEALVLNDFPVSGIDTPTFRGARRYFDFIFHPLRTPDARVTGVLLVVLETTDRVRTRQRLAHLGDEIRRQEAHFQVLTETLPHITSSADADGHNTYTSPQWFSYTGQDPAVSGDVRWVEVVHPDDLVRVGLRYREALAAGEPWEVEFRLRRHDGQYRWHQTRTRPAFDEDGTLRAWHGVTVDVHERTLATEALRRSQAQLARQDRRLQQILGQVPAIIASTEGPQHHYAFSNPGHDALLRRTVVLGRTVAELWPEPEDHALVALLDTVYRTGRPETGTEVKVTVRDPYSGERHITYLDRTFQALRDDQGRIHGVLAFAVDVTDRVLARQQAQSLQQEMQARDEQLRAQNEVLMRNNQDLDNFVYAASHDLKQPVDNLAGLFAELRGSAAFGPDDQNVLHLVDRALQQLRTTIDDLSTVGQVQRQPELPLDAVDIAELTQEVLHMLAPQVAAGPAGIRTDFSALPTLPYPRSDLRTILLNLLGNALKYAHPERGPDIQVRTYLAGSQPVLLVSDNGVGLDVERHRDELFHIFQRFHSHVGGTGVGLYLVNRLVQARGGRVEVESEVDNGATFRVYLTG